MWEVFKPRLILFVPPITKVDLRSASPSQLLSQSFYFLQDYTSVVPLAMSISPFLKACLIHLKLPSHNLDLYGVSLRSSLLNFWNRYFQRMYLHPGPGEIRKDHRLDFGGGRCAPFVRRHGDDCLSSRHLSAVKEIIV